MNEIKEYLFKSGYSIIHRNNSVTYRFERDFFIYEVELEDVVVINIKDINRNLACSMYITQFELDNHKQTPIEVFEYVVKGMLEKLEKYNKGDR